LDTVNSGPKTAKGDEKNMTKPIILTINGAANAILNEEFVEQDGSGSIKAFDGTGSPVGLAVNDKDVDDNVPVLKLGLVNLPAAADTYNPGDPVEATTQGVTALSGGTQVGTIASPAPVVVANAYSEDEQVIVYLNVA